MDELGEAAGAGLLHHPSAVNLDGPRAHAEGMGDELVRQTRDHPPHHLALARGQSLEPAEHGGIGPGGGATHHRAGDARQQRVGLEGLLDEIDGAGAHRPRGHGYVAMRRHHDDRHALSARAERFEEGEAIHPRHAHVEQHAPGPAGVEPVEEGGRGGAGFHGMAMRGEQRLERLPHARVVVDDVDDRPARRPAHARTGRERQGEGEDGAAARRGVGPDAAAVGLDDRAAHREADAHALGLGGHEGCEDLGAGEDARPVVGDRDPDGTAVAGGGDDERGCQRAGLEHRVDAVADQVHHHLLHLDAVGDDVRQPLGELEAGVDPAVGGADDGEPCGFANHLVHHDRLALVGPARDEGAEAADHVAGAMGLRDGLLDVGRGPTRGVAGLDRAGARPRRSWRSRSAAGSVRGRSSKRSRPSPTAGRRG